MYTTYSCDTEVQICFYGLHRHTLVTLKYKSVSTVYTVYSCDT